MLRSPKLLGARLARPALSLDVAPLARRSPVAAAILGDGAARLVRARACALARARGAHRKRPRRSARSSWSTSPIRSPPRQSATPRPPSVRALDARKSDDVARVVTFARRPRLVEMDEKGKSVPELARHDVSDEHPPRRGDQFAGRPSAGLWALSAGLPAPRGALLRRSRDRRRFACRGKPRAEIRGQALHGPLPAAAYRARSRCSGFASPIGCSVGEPFEVHADVYASRAAEAQARLFQGEALNGLEGARTLAARARA